MQRRHLFPLAPLTAAATISFAQAPDGKKIRIPVEGAYPQFCEIDPDGGTNGFPKRPAGQDFASLGPAFVDPNCSGTGAGVAVRTWQARTSS